MSVSAAPNPCIAPKNLLETGGGGVERKIGRCTRTDGLLPNPFFLCAYAHLPPPLPPNPFLLFSSFWAKGRKDTGNGVSPLLHKKGGREIMTVDLLSNIGCGRSDRRLRSKKKVRRRPYRSLAQMQTKKKKFQIRKMPHCIRISCSVWEISCFKLRQEMTF